jgi:hypothetical protein
MLSKIDAEHKDLSGFIALPGTSEDTRTASTKTKVMMWKAGVLGIGPLLILAGSEASGLDGLVGRSGELGDSPLPEQPTDRKGREAFACFNVMFD